MSDLSDVKVGDTLYFRDVNENRRRDPNFVPPSVTVVKVGPKRVGYMTAWGKMEFARKADGYIDDWHWLQIPADYDDAREHAVIVSRLRYAGIDVSPGKRLSTDTLRRVLAVVEQDS